MDKIKILLVDDHHMIREGLKALVGQNANMRVVGEAENGKQALDFIKKREVDLVLMDIDMPIMNGIETTKIIYKDHPSVRVLALTMHDDHAHIISMLQSGVGGYISKTSSKKVLEEAIRQVTQGKNYFPNDVTAAVMQRYSKKKSALKSATAEALTPRQQEVLKLIAQGLTNPQISEKLFISKRTVDAHRRNLLEKLQVKNTAGLVRHAMRLNLIEAL